MFNKSCSLNKLTVFQTIAELEKEMLNGQSAQGPPTAAELYETLKKDNLTGEFPLFVAVHKICTGEVPATSMIDLIRDHPGEKTVLV